MKMIQNQSLQEHQILPKQKQIIKNQLFQDYHILPKIKIIELIPLGTTMPS